MQLAMGTVTDDNVPGWVQAPHLDKAEGWGGQGGDRHGQLCGGVLLHAGMVVGVWGIVHVGRVGAGCKVPAHKWDFWKEWWAVECSVLWV